VRELQQWVPVRRRVPSPQPRLPNAGDDPDQHRESPVDSAWGASSGMPKLSP